LHNPFLAYDLGEDFLRAFHLAADGKLAPFIPVIEGSIPNEPNKKEGYWASFGTNQATDQPIITCEWIDRLAPKAWAVGGDLCHLWWYPCDGGESDRLYGPSRLSGLEMEIGRWHSHCVCAGMSAPTR
jgi:hypothetical protein